MIRSRKCTGFKLTFLTGRRKGYVIFAFYIKTQKQKQFLAVIFRTKESK